MTDSDLLTWLSSDAVLIKWDYRTGWTVRAFGRVEGTAPTLRDAAKVAIRHQRHLAGEARTTPMTGEGVDLFAPTLRTDGRVS